MMDRVFPRCAACSVDPSDRLCSREDGMAPAFCPTRDAELVGRALKEYKDPRTMEFARVASVQEGICYEGRGPGVDTPRPVKPRLLEVAEFSDRMGFHRLGLAFCSGLAAEALLVEGFFADRGFEVVSVVCKAGRTPKENIGVRDSEKIHPGSREAMCAPILQAEVMNSWGTEFNIVLGLCVGHDSLFLKHSEAPCTVLAAKDRVYAHNPLGAVYTLGSYSRYLKDPDI